MTREDPILGTVRLCRKCDEEWPVDDDFWYFQVRRGERRATGPCKACWSERKRDQYAKDRDAQLSRNRAYRERVKTDPDLLQKRRENNRRASAAYRERRKGLAA